ncbi:MAG: hypothetical protein AAF999_08050 [Pseudomonadota bacterium]
MTKPERLPDTKVLAERAKSHGAESLHMYEAAQRAIEDTRKLLIQVTQDMHRFEGRPE